MKEGDQMKALLPLLLCVILSGCASGPIRAVGRVLAPVQETELDESAQAMLSTAREQHAKELSDVQAALEKAKQRKPVSLWPIYLIAGIAMVGGPVIGYLVKKFASGIILAVSGALSIMALQFMQTYFWAMWIPFGLAVAVGLWFFIGYVRGVLAQKALEAIAPAVERVGTRELKDAIQAQSKANRSELLTKAGVTLAKWRM